MARDQDRHFYMHQQLLPFQGAIVGVKLKVDLEIYTTNMKVINNEINKILKLIFNFVPASVEICHSEYPKCKNVSPKCYL